MSVFQSQIERAIGQGRYYVSDVAQPTPTAAQFVLTGLQNNSAATATTPVRALILGCEFLLAGGAGGSSYSLGLAVLTPGSKVISTNYVGGTFTSGNANSIVPIASGSVLTSTCVAFSGRNATSVANAGFTSVLDLNKSVGVAGVVDFRDAPIPLNTGTAFALTVGSTSSTVVGGFIYARWTFVELPIGGS